MSKNKCLWSSSLATMLVIIKKSHQWVFLARKKILLRFKKKMWWNLYFCGRLMERDMKEMLEYIVLTTPLLPLTHNFLLLFYVFYRIVGQKTRETSQEQKQKGINNESLRLRMEEFNKISLSVYRFLLCLSFLLWNFHLRILSSTPTSYIKNNINKKKRNLKKAKMGSCCCPFLSNFLNYSHSYGNWMYNNYCKPKIAHTKLFTMNISGW